MKTKKREGISLIVLVLTIIVIVILATAVILSIANNNPIENAKKAKFLNDVKTFEEDYALRTLNSYFEPDNEVEITISDLTDNEEYRKKLTIRDGKIVLKESAATEQEIKWAKEAGIKVLGSTYLKENFLRVIGMWYGFTKVIFEDTTKNAPSEFSDISVAGDNSVIGWLDGTEAHIASDETIYAPENFNSLFYDMEKLTEIQNIDLLDTSKVTDMSFMFARCSNLQSLDLTSFDTSNVTDMACMFYGCSNLQSLDLTSFDTSNVTNMACMFYGCSNLQSLDLTSFDTSNVTNMAAMFEACTRLASLDVSNFDTSNVINMTEMFESCENLTSLDLSSFDISNVTDMSDMFESCENLTSLDLSNFDTSNVTNMSYMLFNCNALTKLDLSSFDTSNVISMSSMFYNCSSLSKVEVSNKFNTNNVTSSRSMFYNCTSLVGGNGTTYNSNYVDASYARIDTAETPGYFTLKSK